MSQVTIDIVTIKSEILKCLLQSKMSGTMIGITSPVLGAGTFITAVTEVVTNDDDPIVIVKGYDLSGYFLERNTLSLSDITSVLPFNSLFENPFLRELQKDIDHLKTAEENENIRNADFIF